MGWGISIIGIVLNFWALGQIMSKSPEGGMGMGILIIPCFMPFLIFGFFVTGFVVEKVKGWFAR